MHNVSNEKVRLESKYLITKYYCMALVLLRTLPSILSDPYDTICRSITKHNMHNKNFAVVLQNKILNYTKLSILLIYTKQ